MELKTPVIYGGAPRGVRLRRKPEHGRITSVVRSRDVIAGLHLDHNPTFDNVVECIRDGYTSVMFDGSPTGAEPAAHP